VLAISGSLRALLLSHEATRLLGLPAKDLTASGDDVMQLQQYLEFLTSVDADGGVWMDVALTPVYPAGAVKAAAAAAAAPHLHKAAEDQHGLDPEHTGTADVAGSTKCKLDVVQCRLILHDAICCYMQQQEQTAELQHEEGSDPLSEQQELPQELENQPQSQQSPFHSSPQQQQQQQLAREWQEDLQPEKSSSSNGAAGPASNKRQCVR